jgi:signal recognition particle receptor subunit beta
MVVFNPVKKEIDIKIVYYGPALCGKTTNLQSVHLSLNPQQRGELVSLATKDDRTLFFDFLPIELDNIKGFKTRFHIYTVPGQVFYTLTRKAVLTGVDGIIFVADSQTNKMEENVESMDDLRENLKYYKKDVESIPYVMQYNKRDLNNIMPLDEMERKLNVHHAPSFEASAIDGKGVMETLTMCCKMVLKQIQDKSHISQPIPGSEKAEERTAAAQTEPEFPRITLVESPADEETIDDSQHLSQGNGLTETVQESPLQEIANHSVTAEDAGDRLEAVEPDDRREISFPEGPALTNPEEHRLGNELLEKEPVIDLLEPELQINDVMENTSPASNDQTVYQEEITAPPATSPDGTISPEDPAQDSKRTCPRCLLKFNPNVKQCPICKVSLFPEAGEEEPAGAEQDLSSDTTPQGAELVSQETVEPFTGQDESLSGQHLEIVACGEPKKTSATAIRVPLVMKINETEKEIEVDLAINFGNVLLK